MGLFPWESWMYWDVLAYWQCKTVNLFSTNLIRKIIISDGSLVTYCILHQAAGCHCVLFIAAEEGFAPSLRPILGRLTILSFFLFYMVLSWSLFLLTAPIYVHDNLLGHMESSNRVRARFPKGIRLDKPGWMPLCFPHTSVPLPGIYQAPGLFHCPINFSSWILLGLISTISFN